MLTVARHLRQYRDCGTAKSVAVRAGISPVTYSHWELGYAYCKLSAEKAARVAHIIGVEPEQIIDDEGFAVVYTT